MGRHSLVHGYLPETDGEAPPHYGVTGHAEAKLLLAWGSHPDCLAFIIPEGAVHIAGEEKPAGA